MLIDTNIVTAVYSPLSLKTPIGPLNTVKMRVDPEKLISALIASHPGMKVCPDLHISWSSPF